MLAVSLPSLLSAQVTPAPAQVPGLPSRSQVEQPAPPAAPSTARVTGRDAVPTAPCPLADSTLTVNLVRVQFTALGREAVPAPIAEALAGIAPPVQGDQLISAVCAIRDSANAALARAGFVASVQVPPQRITDGTLTLSVVLARIVEVRVHGEAGRYRPVLARAIERLRALDPLNERDAERLLLYTGDVPGLDVQLSLRPAGTAPGEVIGDLNIAIQRVVITANVQNYGSRALGRETAYVRADLNGLLTSGDTLYVGGSTTLDFREQQVAQLGYRIQLSDTGLTAGPRLTYAWSRPDIGGLDLRSRSLIGGFDITQSLVRSVRNNLVASIGFEFIEQRTKTYDPQGKGVPLILDQLRVLYARIDGRVSARRADGLDAFSIAGALELRKGLGILNASRQGKASDDDYITSRFEGDPQAFVIRGSLSALGRASSTFSVLQTVLGQWSNHPLLNFDEQALGNLTVGLGYDPGANTADRFLGLHSEVRADFELIKGVPFQVFGFMDNVWIWNLDAFSTENDRRLRSVGGGVRARLPGPFLLEVAYAKPLDKALSFDRERASPRLLVSLTTQFSSLFR